MWDVLSTGETKNTVLERELAVRRAHLVVLDGPRVSLLLARKRSHSGQVSGSEVLFVLQFAIIVLWYGSRRGCLRLVCCCLQVKERGQDVDM